MGYITKNRKKLCIDREAIKMSLDKRGHLLSEKDSRIIIYLVKNVPSSPREFKFSRFCSFKSI